MAVLLTFLKIAGLVLFGLMLIVTTAQLSSSSGEGAGKSTPLVAAYASTILFLGDSRSFGFLDGLVPAQVLNINASLRAWALLLFGSVLGVLFIGYAIGRVARDGFELAKARDVQRPRLEPDANLLLIELLVKAYSDVAFAVSQFVGWIIRVLRAIGTVAALAAWDVISGLLDVRRLILGAILGAQVFLTLVAISIAPSWARVIGSLGDVGGFSVSRIAHLGLFFLWLAVSLYGVSVASLINHKVMSGYAIVTTVIIAAVGVWVFSLVAHVCVLFGVDVPGYRIHADHWLLFGGALGLLIPLCFAAEISAAARRFTIGFTLVVLIFWGVLFFVRPTSPAPPTTPGSGQVGAVAPTKEAAMEPSSGSWLLGKWGVAGDCSSPIQITVAERGIDISHNGAVWHAPVSSASDTSVVTSEAEYVRDGQGVVMRSRGAELTLSRCD